MKYLLILFLLLLPAISYADSTICGLNPAQTLTGSECIPIMQNGLTVKTTPSALSSFTGGVTSFSGGSTGLTPSTPTAGAIVLAGVLNAANGGTGNGSQTTNGIIYYNGSALTSGNSLTFDGTNVGIGTNVMANKLDVNGAVSIGTTNTAAPTNGLVVSGHLVLEGVTSTGSTGSGALVFGTAPTFTTNITAPVIIDTASSGNGITLTSLTTGNGISATATTTGKGYTYNTTAATATTSGAINVTGTATMTADYAGNFVGVTPTRTMTAAATRAESGSMLGITPTYSITGTLASVMNVSGAMANFNRTLTNSSSSASSSLNISGPVASFASAAPTRTNPVVNTASVVTVTQNDTQASGTAFTVVTSGTGAAATITGGFVGIGTASPFVALDVNGTTRSSLFSGSGASLTTIGTASLSATGTANSTTFLRGDNTWGSVASSSGTVGSGLAGQNAYYQADGTTVIGTSSLMIVGGRVGIGSSVPQAQLDVNGVILATNSGSATAPAYAFEGNANSGMWFNAGAIDFTVAGADRWQFAGQQLRGVGAASPSFVNSTAVSTTTPNILPDKADVTTGFAAGVLGNINAIVGGTEIMRWAPSGVGIGTSTINAGGGKLQIYGDGLAVGGAVGTTYPSTLAAGFQTGGSSGQGLLIAVGTTTTNPTFSIMTSFSNGANGIIGFFIDNSNHPYLPGAGSASLASFFACYDNVAVGGVVGQITYQASNCTTSLRVTKDGIREMTNGLGLAMSLDPVSFWMKNDPHKRIQYGLIAEDVEATDARLAVYDDKTGALRSVQYDRLGVVAIAAIQEQQKEIEQLKIEIERLKKRGVK